MDNSDCLAQYESRSGKKYRAFTRSSLIQLWPSLHRNAIVWVALFVNVGAALLSVYASSLLDQSSEDYNFAVVILLVTTVAGLSIFISQSIEQWIHVTEENNVRRILLERDVKNPSLANIDLPNAVFTISFYVAFPAQLASLIVYAGYVVYHSLSSFFIVLAVAVVFAYPIYLYAIWRQKMIRVIRAYRNRLVDNFGEKKDDYAICVDRYAHASMEFFWRDIQAVYLLRIVVFVVLLMAIKFNEAGGHSFSVLVAMMLLLASGQNMFLALCVFQEDKVSLGRVKSVIDSQEAARPEAAP